MKKIQYVNPEVEYVLLDEEDILTTSIPTEEDTTTSVEEEETTTAYDADQVHDGSIFG